MHYPKYLLTFLAISPLVAQTIISPSKCGLPLSLVDTSRPNAVVGSGSAGSCTEAALDAALAIGGIITFNCGAAAVIPITRQHSFRNDIGTVLDGGNRVTLQGNGTTRLFVAKSGDAPWYGGTPPYYQSTRTAVTLQNITLAGGRSSGTALPPLPAGAPSNCSQGTDYDGGGGAIYVRDMVLHVINSNFTGNRGPSSGPDVAGGAIFALGSLDVTIQGSKFQSNDSSNGGAVGMLESDMIAVDSVFTGNAAVGHDGNHNIASSGCPIHLNQNQVGSGGSAGAVYLDGQAAGGHIFCGDQFLNNHGGANALGGALLGAGDPGVQSLIILQSEFDGNQNTNGGALYGYLARIIAVNSTFSNNKAQYGGAMQVDENTQLISVNNTYAANSATTAVGTVAAFSGSNGVFLNNTFSGNTAPYFPIIFPGDGGSPAPNLVFVNNIFSGNVGQGFRLRCHATLPGANNILFPPSALTPPPEGACASGQIIANPQLSPLADNGGGILTMAIPATSPAAHVGTTNCPATDARGVPRSSVCSAGAYQP